MWSVCGLYGGCIGAVLSRMSRFRQKNEGEGHIGVRREEVNRVSLVGPDAGENAPGGFARFHVEDDAGTLEDLFAGGQVWPLGVRVKVAILGHRGTDETEVRSLNVSMEFAGFLSHAPVALVGEDIVLVGGRQKVFICIGLYMIGQLSDLGVRLRASDRSAQQAAGMAWLC